MENNFSKSFPQNHEYFKNQELFQNHILEQYKLYVEMADRISMRRNLANVFFLTINSSIIGFMGLIFEKFIDSNIFICLCIGAIVISIFWWFMIKSYQQLNTAKFKVIGKIEELLPISPYWKEEWKELGQGKNFKKYIPMTIIESYVPIISILIYIAMMIIAVNR